MIWIDLKIVEGVEGTRPGFHIKKYLLLISRFTEIGSFQANKILGFVCHIVDFLKAQDSV